MWDEEYSVEEYVYGKAANEFLIEMSGPLNKWFRFSILIDEGTHRIGESIWRGKQLLA